MWSNSNACLSRTPRTSTFSLSYLCSTLHFCYYLFILLGPFWCVEMRDDPERKRMERTTGHGQGTDTVHTRTFELNCCYRWYKKTSVIEHPLRFGWWYNVFAFIPKWANNLLINPKLANQEGSFIERCRNWTYIKSITVKCYKQWQYNDTFVIQKS